MKRLALLLLLVSVASADEIREHFLKALRFEYEGRHADSRKHYRAVLRLDPNHLAAKRALGRSARALARDALALTWKRDARSRRLGVSQLALIEGREGARGLMIALRNRRADVRMHAAQTLGARGDVSVVPALIARLHGGTGQSSYIAQTRQVRYIQDFDVEIA